MTLLFIPRVSITTWINSCVTCMNGSTFTAQPWWFMTNPGYVSLETSTTPWTNIKKWASISWLSRMKLWSSASVFIFLCLPRDPGSNWQNIAVQHTAIQTSRPLGTFVPELQYISLASFYIENYIWQSVEWIVKYKLWWHDVMWLTWVWEKSQVIIGNEGQNIRI